MSTANLRLALALSATVLFVTPARASVLLLTQIASSDWAPSSVPITFSISTSPSAILTANFTTVGQVIQFGANDSTDLTAFTNSITNGTLDTLTFAVNAESFTRPESFFAVSGTAAPVHFNEVNFPTGIDWKGFRIDYYQAWLAHSGGGTFNDGKTIVELKIFGGLPEPSSIALSLLGCLFLLPLCLKDVVGR